MRPHEPSGLPRVREVGAERDTAHARGLELADRPARLARRTMVADRHVHPRVRQSERDHPPHTPGAARDERARRRM